MIYAQYQVTKPDAVNMTLTVQMEVGDWRKLAEHLGVHTHGNEPHQLFSRAVHGLIRSADPQLDVVRLHNGWSETKAADE